MISFHFTRLLYFLRCILHCKKYKLKTYYLTLQSSVPTPSNTNTAINNMTPVTRQTASIHIASHTSRYDYLNAAKKNLDNNNDDKQQSSYDQECFEEEDHGGDDARISISTRTTRTTRNSKLKQQQQPAPSKKTVAFAKQSKTQQEQAPPAQQQQQQQQHEEQHTTGKRVSKRQAAKYDAHIDAVEAADILASIAAAAAAGPKERTPPYWTRQHEKAKAGARLQKAMSSVLRCDD